MTLRVVLQISLLSSQKIILGFFQKSRHACLFYFSSQLEIDDYKSARPTTKYIHKTKSITWKVKRDKVKYQIVN